MAKYISQLRRGVKDDTTGRNDWASYETRDDRIKPLRGELVLEYDNGVPRLKIGNGDDDFSILPYMSVDSFLFSKVAKITLYGGDAWERVSNFEGRYVQDITEQIKDKITIHSKIDLQPTPEQLCVFHEKDVAFTTVNEGGQVRVCAIGIRPEQTYEDIHITISEVTESGIIIGDTTATPNPQSNWAQTNPTKADYIKNKPNLITKDELSAAVSSALADAKENGELGGANGKSAYELAVENGFEGSVTEWLESLKGTSNQLGGITFRLKEDGKLSLSIEEG